MVLHGKVRVGRSSARTGSRTPIVVDVLGGRILNQGSQAHLPPAGLAVVLALALKECPVTRDALADELYPDGDMARSIVRLKVNVHRVKRRLGLPDVIRIDRGKYSLGWCVDVDFRRLAAMVRSLSRVHGLNFENRALLVDIRRRVRGGRPACALEWPWFEDTERALTALDYDAAVLLANDALRDGRYNDAMALTAELLRADPVDEIAAEIAIRASLQSGDRLGAALQFRRYTETLRRVTSEPPPAMLRQLIGQTAAL